MPANLLKSSLLKLRSKVLEYPVENKVQRAAREREGGKDKAREGGYRSRREGNAGRKINSAVKYECGGGEKKKQKGRERGREQRKLASSMLLSYQ